ncbi:MAG: DoxX family protein [Pyrinomonadaceae bacterium]
MLRSFIETTPTWVTLPLRLALGAVFIGHGAQKVFGVWGGPGLEKWISGQAPLGLRPAALWLAVAAFSELIGGALVLLGLLTRVGALAIAGVMIVAMIGVHWSGGFFLQSRGIEYTVVLLAMAVALVIAGGGHFSADAKFASPRRRR